MALPKPTSSTAIVVVVALAMAAGFGGCGGDEESGDEAGLQTVRFQTSQDAGPDPFTAPADVRGSTRVPVSAAGGGGSGGGSQPFGGSGSNRVCDRDKLIGFLQRNPDRMRAWAEVLGVEPNFEAVRRYIARLHPVTLTRDTQVTNHSFKNGQAVGFQAILKAGTAVLVDEYGTPVVRCYCGNPLKPPVYVPTAKCLHCPPNYTPPKQCRYHRRRHYDRTYYPRDDYTNAEYDQVFVDAHKQGPYRDCYSAYPDPPVVKSTEIFPAAADEEQLQEQGQPPPQATTPQTPTQEDPCHNGVDDDGDGYVDNECAQPGQPEEPGGGGGTDTHGGDQGQGQGQPQNPHGQ